MALAISHAFLCPKLQFSQRNFRSNVPGLRLPPSFVRTIPQNRRVICAAASAAGSSNPDSDLNPYEVLGVSPFEGFDMIKAAYTKKHKEAVRSGDDATAARLEKAYDKVMMAQLTNRKKGVTFGSFKVSKDIRYADKQPIVPWGPRFTKSSVQDMRINLAISAVFVAWLLIKRNAEYKPLQFLTFAFVYRIFEKLKSFEPPVSPTYTEDGEDAGRGLRMGKRLLRSLALVFGCIAIASVGYTTALNLIEYMGSYIPAALYNNQELIITSATAFMLYIMASYYSHMRLKYFVKTDLNGLALFKHGVSRSHRVPQSPNALFQNPTQISPMPTIYVASNPSAAAESSSPGLYSAKQYELTVPNVDLVLEDVRPYLISDGGNVDVVSVEDGVVSLKLQGACGSCPSSTTTMKMGIERVLKEKFGDALKDIQQVFDEENKEITVEVVNRHLDILRPAIKNFGGSVEVLSVEGGDCHVNYVGPESIGSGIKAAIKEKFPDIVNVVFTG
ncbi:hypothetical protein D8674_019758 [Pyrus ussuriensis x Pyrus communis]|uniref:NIF system FeS cluster assembly NifU C-terminal domain-containing protein n=1 Tax=Pyrus ussuriensis x Pyrus communis TaxID=2448454 RepID=A0A5N5G8M9_9ROSA|nr:hypothetical protein D8674_019758 [Pyrus ussuriensis x Pyrus communis]